MSRGVVQSLWIGSRLSVMEQLCIRSFLDHGHPFHLYTYQEIGNVPDGTVVRDGTVILPAEEIFVYRKGCGKGSPSAFSNFFRYKLLLQHGGWWSDLDAVCTRPLDFPDDHVAGYEREKDGSLHPAVGLIHVPPGSPLMEYCWDYCRRIDRSTLRWGRIGPGLFARAVRESGVPIRLLPPEDFYPVDHWQFRKLICETRLPEDGYSIHLWNSKWRRYGLDPDARYDRDCIYEQLKRRHRIASPAVAKQANTAADGRHLGVLGRLFRRFRPPKTPSRAA